MEVGIGNLTKEYSASACPFSRRYNATMVACAGWSNPARRRRHHRPNESRIGIPQRHFDGLWRLLCQSQGVVRRSKLLFLEHCFKRSVRSSPPRGLSDVFDRFDARKELVRVEFNAIRIAWQAKCILPGTRLRSNQGINRISGCGRGLLTIAQLRTSKHIVRRRQYAFDT